MKITSFASWRLTTLSVLISAGASWALEFGNVEIVQNDNGNDSTSVTATVVAGSTSAVTVLNQNRGDTDISLGNGNDDPKLGIIVSSVSQNSRNNFAFGDLQDGPNYASTCCDFPSGSGGYFVPLNNMGGSAENLLGRAEYNMNFAVTYFPYADGWLGGRAGVSANGGPLTEAASILAPGISLGAQILENGNGRFTVDLTNLSNFGVAATSQNGILLHTHGKNEGNFTMAMDNADGTFNVTVMDNGEFGSGNNNEQDPFAFVYIPSSLAGPNLIAAMGRIQSDGTAEVSGGTYTITPQDAPGKVVASGAFESELTDDDADFLAPYTTVIATGAFESELRDVEGGFDTLLTDFTNKTYLLEILDGTAVGETTEITAATATDLTVATAVNAGAAGYRISEIDFSNRSLLVEITSGPASGQKATITRATATGLTTDIALNAGAADYRISEPATEWLLQIPGQDNTTGVLVVAPEGGFQNVSPLPNNTDNFASYEWSTAAGGWIIQSRDVPGNPANETPQAAQEGGLTPDEDMFSFAFFTTTPQNAQPEIVIDTPVDGTLLPVGSTVTATATATDSDGSITQVEFFVNGASVAVDTSAPYQATVGPFSGLFNGEIEALATDNDGGSKRSAPTLFSIVPPAGNGGLYFNGLGQHVTFGDAPELKLTTFTLETWFRREGPGEATETGAVTAIPLMAKGRNESDQSQLDMNYFLGIRESDGVLVADFEDSNLGTNVPVAGRTPVAEGVWQHAAVTFDGSEWRLYLNGNLEAVKNTGGLTPRADSIQHASLASALNSIGEPDGYFQGLLDETRIWSVARSQSEIRASVNFEVASAANLVGRWAMTEGSGVTITSTAAGSVIGDLNLTPFWVDGVTFTNNIKPDVTLTQPEDGGRYNLNDTVSIAAAANDPDGSIAQVEFFDGTTSIGVDSSPPYTASITVTAPGAKALSAVATDNNSGKSASEIVTINVVLPAPSIPGYTAGVIDGGSRDLDEIDSMGAPYVPPGNGAFTYNIESTTASPLSFDTPSQDRGDFGVFINGTAVPFDTGVMLATNTATLDNLASIDNITSPFRNGSGNYVISTTDNNGPGATNPSTSEESGRFSLGYFPYADGWFGANIDGRANSLVDNVAPVLNGSSNYPSGNPVTATMGETGIYTISGLPTSGNLMVVPVSNNYDNVVSVGISGSDWVVNVRDNGGGLEAGIFGMVYVPFQTRQALSGLVKADGTLVPLNEELELLGANVNLGSQGYEITFGDGSVINPSTASLFVTADFDNGGGGDNIYSYFANGDTFVVFAQDLPGLSRAFEQGGFRFLVTPINPVVLNGDEVILTATDPSSTEGGDTGEFTFRRFGDTASALTVSYSLGGTAASGFDYTPLSGTATFGVGETTTTVTVEGLTDGFLELTESIVATLLPGSGYSLGSYLSATVSIVNVNPTVATTTISFQEGVQSYTGQFDKSIGENGTDVLGSTVSNYFLDGSPESSGSPDVNGIIRFDNIFGNGPGQIPPGAGIQDAQIIITTSTVGNAQSGGPYIVDRLTVPVSETTTYLDLQLGDLGDGFEGVRGASTGLPVAGFGVITNGQVVNANVTALVQAWSSGAPNYGFSVFTGGTTDGWSYNTVGNPNPLLRPKLQVTYTVDTTLKDYFFLADQNSIINNQQGTNNTSSAALDGSTIQTQFLDLNDANAGTTEALIRFPVSFGVSGDLQSIPDGESVVKAELLVSTNSPKFGGSGNAQTGGPYAVHQMLVDWDVMTTFGLTGPVVPNDIDFAAGRVVGMGQGSTTFVDITSVIQNWRAGAPNYGVNLKPETTDGWQPFWLGVETLTPGLADFAPILRVTTAILEGNSFDDYMATNGAAGANFLDDRDKDGIVGLIEYGLGLNPIGYDLLPGLVANGNDLTLTFNKGALASSDPNVSYAIELSPDLQNWNDATPAVNDASQISASLPRGMGKMFARIRIDYAQ